MTVTDKAEVCVDGEEIEFTDLGVTVEEDRQELVKPPKNNGKRINMAQASTPTPVRVDKRLTVTLELDYTYQGDQYEHDVDVVVTTGDEEYDYGAMFKRVDEIGYRDGGDRYTILKLEKYWTEVEYTP